MAEGGGEYAHPLAGRAPPQPQSLQSSPAASGSGSSPASGSGSSREELRDPHRRSLTSDTIPLYRTTSNNSSQGPPEYRSRSQWGASQSSLDRMRRGSNASTFGVPPVPAVPPTAYHADHRPAPKPHSLHFAPDVKAPAPPAPTLPHLPTPGLDLSNGAGQGSGGATPTGEPGGLRVPYGSHPGTPAASDTEGDNEFGEDAYDWDNDDDLEGEARFEELSLGEKEPAHHRRKTLAKRFSPYTIVKWFLTTFIGNVLISLALVVPPLIFRYTGYYKEGDDPSAEHTRYVYDNVAAWCFWASFNLLTSWLVHFAVELVPRLAVSIVKLFWGDVSEWLKGGVEVFHAAKNRIKPAIYAAVAWGSWTVLFKDIYRLRDKHDPENLSRAPYTYRLFQIIALLFFVVLVVCVEKLVLLAISMNFHRVAYADRIKKVTEALGILDKLKDYRPKRKPARPAHSRNASSEFLGGPRSAWRTGARTPTTPATGTPTPLSASGGAGGKARWWTRKTESPREADDVEMATRTPPTLSRSNSRESHMTDMSVAPGADAMSRKDGETASLGKYISKRSVNAAQVARAAMKDPVAVVGRKSGLGLDINSPREAKRLAKEIYLAFKADPKRAYLITSDFYPAFPTESAAKTAFALFDKDGNGDISKTEIKNVVMTIYKERRALARSLGDVQHAIGRLDGILLGMAAIVLVFIALAVFGVDFTKAITSAYTIGLAMAFVIKETASNVFDAIILIFVQHPYDTGDRIFMDNNGVEECLVVKRMGLLVTVFERWDGTEWFAPNALLGQKIITNLRRSDAQFENATLQMGWDTPLEKLTQLEEKMNSWLSTDPERRFAPSTACVIQKLVNNNYMEVTLGMVHATSWQDWGTRWTRRTAFHAALNHYTRQLGITLRNPEMPIIYNPADLDGLPDFGPTDDNSSSDPRSPFSPSDGDDEDEDGPATAIEPSSNKPYERAAPVMGFAPPPESGTGMRRRKRISRKKAMYGDA